MLISISAKLDLAKNDRVIANMGSKKEPEYFLGTVTRVSGANISVVFDDGGKITLTKRDIVGKTELKKKRKTQIPTKDLKTWLSVDVKTKAVPKAPAKAPVKAVPKVNVGVKKTDIKQAPVTKQVKAEVKKSDTNGWLLHQQERPVEGKKLDVRNLPKNLEELYGTSLYGLLYPTGRRTGQDLLTVVGFGYEKGHLIGYGFQHPPKRNILERIFYIKERDLVAKAKTLKRVKYATFLAARNAASHFVKVLDTNTKERTESNHDAYTKLADKLKEGMRVPIKFSNGTFTKTIQKIDYRAGKIGIPGSGSQLRWIPFSLIGDISHTTTTASTDTHIADRLKALGLKGGLDPFSGRSEVKIRENHSTWHGEVKEVRWHDNVCLVVRESRARPTKARPKPIAVPFIDIVEVDGKPVV